MRDTPTTWLYWCTIMYAIMNGAGLWETALFVPAWTQAPPASLHYFHQPYGIESNHLVIFWVSIHSIHEIVFIITLITNWKTSRRNYLLLLFIAHMAVRAWTLLYFAPSIMFFQSIPISNNVDPELVSKANLWKNLNYIRGFLFICINVLMAKLLTKDDKIKLK